MGIVDGREPEESDADRYRELPARVVIKFAADTGMGDLGPAEEVEVAARRLGGEWSRLLDRLQDIRLRPYIEDIGLPAWEERSARSDAGMAAAGDALRPYFVVEMPPGEQAEALAAELRELPGVESAYVEAGPVPPPVNPTDDPRSANQGYLDAAPSGIDARWAWSLVDGLGIGFVDMERGWTLGHEDLSDAGITLISGLNQDYWGHGTAVLGEVVAVDNTIGGVGIAPRARARVVSQWRTSTNYSTAAAIASAVAVMSRGDILLLEAQTTVGTQVKIPVETEQAVFDAIVAAVGAGIVVVEAAGNGGLDLDNVTDPAGMRVFDPSSPNYRDSGAILVGAASSTAPHTRSSFSNYGSRVNCYGWGESIDTTGDGWTGNTTTAYTSGFGGTSGASPIVAGAAVLLQAWAAAYGGARYSPAGIRSVLSLPGVNTPSQAPSTDRIGVMPNLRSIIEREQVRRRFDPDRWRMVVEILFGVIQDGGGIILGPHGPKPVDPWGPLRRMSAAKRDVLLGLALSELAELVDDEASRHAAADQSTRVIAAAVERLSAAGGSATVD
jgi:hypothetical protein